LHYAEVCPLYETLSLAIASDPELLALATHVKHTPISNIFLSTIHYLLLSGVKHPLARYFERPANAAAADAPLITCLRDFCMSHQEAMMPLLRTRIVQTNEVRRCADLLPAMVRVAQEASTTALALIEVGASAGFTLLWDHYAYETESGVVFGCADSPVRLPVRLRGPNPAPAFGPVPDVIWRRGIDLNPIDITNPTEALWLRALIWPSQVDRVMQLTEVMHYTQDKIPPIIPGDALKQLGPLLDAAPANAALVVFHSMTLNQFNAEARLALDRLLDDFSSRRPVWRVAREAIGVHYPELRLLHYDKGLRSDRLLGRCAHHGQWLEWLA
jgi:hypothetical protein